MAEPFDPRAFISSELPSPPFDPKAFAGTPPTSDPAVKVDGGFVRGLKDAPEAITQLIGKIVEAVAPEEGTFGWIGQGAKRTNESLKQMFRENETDYQASRPKDAGIDWPRVGGNVAITAPIGMAFSGATLPGAIGAGLASGGISGATQPVTSDDYWKDKAFQTLTGAALGGLVGGGAHAIGRMISPHTDPMVRALMDKGVTPTPGQIMGGAAKKFEDKVTSVPVVGDVVASAQKRAINDLNRAVYDDVLKPIGDTAPTDVGRKGIETVGNKISSAYDDLLSQVTFFPDQNFTSQIQNIMQAAQGLPRREAEAFQNIVREKVLKQINASPSLSGKAFKEIESSVGLDASRFSKSSDAFQQKLGESLGDVMDALRDGLARVNQGVTVNVNGRSVDAAQRLANLDESWARLVRLEGAGGAAAATEGVFTPSQLSAAVKSADQSVRKRSFARGDALMQDISDAGRSVLGDKYPDSGTAGRLLTLLMGGGIATAAPAAIDHPIATAIGLGTAATAASPYTPIGQKLAAALLAGERPAAAQVVGDVLKSAAPAAASSGPSVYRYAN